MFEQEKWLNKLRLENENDLHLIVVLAVRSRDMQLFILALTLAETGTGRPRKVYLFVRRSHAELSNIIDSDKKIPLIHHTDVF